MAKNNFIDAEKIVNELTESFRKHQVAINESANTVRILNKEYSKLPSDYAKAQKLLIDLSVRRKKEEEAIYGALIKKERAEQANIATQIKSNTLAKSTIDLKNKEIRETEKLENALKKQSIALEKSENLYNKVQSKVNGLTATYNNLATKQALGLRLSISEQAQLGSLTGRLEKYQTVLKKVDADIGKHTRNVGNYASGYNPLSNAIGQISREIPNFGQSLQIGIMSLTNNIGALQDAVGGIVAQNKILEAEGKATRSVMSQIGSSILSFNTGLYIGIALLSAYGKEIGDWASKLFDGSTALKELNDRQKEFNKARFEGRKDAQSDIIEVKKYLSVYNDETLSTKDRMIAYKKLSEQYSYYINDVKDATITNGKYSDGVNKLLTDLEKQKALEKETSIQVTNKQKLIDLEKELDSTLKLEKAQKKQLDIEREKPKIADRATAQAQRTKELKAEDAYNNTLEKRINIQGNINAYQEKINSNEKEIILLTGQRIGLEYQDDKEKKTKKLKEYNQEFKDWIANEYALRHQQISDVMSSNKEIADDESISFDTRTIARSTFYNESIKLAELEKVEQLRLLQNATANELSEVNKNYSDKKITIQEKNKAIYAIEQQTLFDRELIFQNFGTTFSNLTKEYGKNIDELIAHIANKKDDLLIVDEKQLAGLKLYSDTLKKLAQSTDINDISKFKDAEEMKVSVLKNVEKEKTEIDLADIKRQMSVFESQDKNSAAYQDLMQKEIDLKLKLANATAEADKKESDAALKKLEDIKSYLRSFQDEFANKSGFKTLFDAINGDIEGFGENFAVTLNASMQIAQEAFAFINQQSEMRDQEELSRLNSQKETAIAFAGESATAKEEIERQYEERRRQLERKKAEDAKKTALFNAIIDTAQAVVGALAEQNYPGAVLFAEIGAAQIALISSQSIPAYAEGTDNHSGGKMLFNDAKGSDYVETIQTPDGQLKQYSGRNLVMDAPKGTKVFTPEQWNEKYNELLSSNGILPYSSSVMNMPNIEVKNGITLSEMESVMRKYASKGDAVSINIDEKGFVKRVTSAGRTREIMNSRLRTSSRNV